MTAGKAKALLLLALAIPGMWLVIARAPEDGGVLVSAVDDASNDPGTTAPNDVPTGNAESTGPRSVVDPSQASLSAPYRSQTAADAYRHAKKLPAGHPDRLEILGALRAKCRRHQLEESPDAAFDRMIEAGYWVGTREQRSLHSAWATWRKAYCAGVDGDVLEAQLVDERDLAMQVEDPTSDLFAHADLVALANASDADAQLQDSQVRAWLAEVALRSDSPSLVLGAAHHMARAGVGPFALGDAAVPGKLLWPYPGSTDGRIEIIRHAAARLYYCRRFLLCGPRSVAMLFEPYRGPLHAQLGIEGLYREQFAPVVLALIERIVAELMHQRQAAGG